MALEPGARLGPYQIISAAGAGGMGEVYRARDTRLDRTVAIKVLPPDLTSDPAVRHRFERDQPPTFTLTRDVPTLSRPSTVSMLTTRVPTGGTPQPNFRKNGSVREPPADSDIEPGIGIGEELGIGTGMELGSGTDELGIDVPPNGAADAGINLDVEVVPSRSRKSNASPRMNTS